jgi:Asp-tRNA(Asn)/Glu-tRNA(Gln) amidotransferase A subunit family amidase
MDFRTHSITALAQSVRNGDVRAVELVEAALARIDTLNPTVNAFVAIDSDGALASARAVDEARARGDDLGPLAGIPLGVKDLEDARGLPTTYGSAGEGSGTPAANDSILVGRLKDAGCIVVGKTNTPEFGWYGQTDNPVFGTTRNPWNTDHTPGGSSGGSAAALASGMVPLCTGSDGGGSIRIPSSLCGLSGFKSSLGRIPDGGNQPPSWHNLSSSGPMARVTADIVASLDVVIGPDPSDLRSLPMPHPPWLGALDEPHIPVKVAWSPTLGYAKVDAEVLAICERAVKALASLGAEVVQEDRVFDGDPVWSWMTMSNAYLRRELRRVCGEQDWSRVSPGLVEQLELTVDRTAVDLVEAEDQCHLLNLRLVELFHHVRLLVTPTVAAPAPRCGELGVINGDRTTNWVQFTYPFNMTRSPAGTVCVGSTSSGLPVGLQFVGPQHADLVVLRAMAAMEAAVGPPPLAPIG